ncbi:MAG: hypothetical protein Q8L85_07815 [Alphaproteobacteria bacterium]|nr:hypothetical protein [Alphaproteobacteria bacterium]
MLSIRFCFLFICLVFFQSIAIAGNFLNKPDVQHVKESALQMNQAYLNRVIVRFGDDSSYQNVVLKILGQEMNFARDNVEYVFDSHVAMDSTKNLFVSYELFPGEMDLGVMMIDKKDIKANTQYDLHVDIGNSGAYAVKIKLKKR